MLHASTTSLDHDLKLLALSKHCPDREAAARDWIEAVAAVFLEGDFATALKDGIALVKVINAIKTDKVLKFSTSKLGFMQMENINLFLIGCKEIGVPSFESFQTVDLYEQKNMNQVWLLACRFVVSELLHPDLQRLRDVHTVVTVPCWIMGDTLSLFPLRGVYVGVAWYRRSRFYELKQRCVTNSR